MYMINYSYLRPKKAKALKNWTEKSFIKRTDIKAYSYKNATVLPLKNLKVIIYCLAEEELLTKTVNI